MKLRTLGRIGGAIQASGFCTLGYIGYGLVSNTDYKKIIEVLLGDYPAEYKAIGGVVIGLDAILVASAVPILIGAADGLVDLYNGTHHYFSMQVWKQLTRNPETKGKIDKSIVNMLSILDKDI